MRDLRMQYEVCSYLTFKIIRSFIIMEMKLNMIWMKMLPVMEGDNWKSG